VGEGVASKELVTADYHQHLQRAW